MGIIQISNLEKTFTSGIFKKTQIHALSDVSLDVSGGEIFALLGPNGAGKTTLIKILLSIVHPTKGSARLLGHPLGSSSIREKIGYLPENHRYPAFLTARQTLSFFGRLHGISDKGLRERSSRLLDIVGLTQWATTKIRKFSKGMLQRLGLAQALLNDPEVLFLDEPTDGVDPIGRKEIRDILRSLRAEGKTIFLNSHLLSEVEEISDRVAILNSGKLLTTGTISDITSHHLEYEIFTSLPVPEELFLRLSPLCLTAQKKDSLLSLKLRKKEDLRVIMDLLLKESVFIDSVHPKKSKLEDYFINILGSTPAP